MRKLRQTTPSKRNSDGEQKTPDAKGEQHTPDVKQEQQEQAYEAERDANKNKQWVDLARGPEQEAARVVKKEPGQDIEQKKQVKTMLQGTC